MCGGHRKPFTAILVSISRGLDVSDAEHAEARAGAVGTIFCLATRVASTVRAMSTSATESNSIGFIGGGMMATALMNGFLKGKAVPSAQAISVSEPCTCARLNPTRAQSPV